MTHAGYLGAASADDGYFPLLEIWRKAHLWQSNLACADDACCR